MENRNSADYMEFEETVKVRRRQIFPLNNLIRLVKTPLFPTGELVCGTREMQPQDAIGHINNPLSRDYSEATRSSYPLTAFRIIAQKRKRIRNGHQTRMEKTLYMDRASGFDAGSFIRWT